MGVTGVICHHVNSENSQKKSFVFLFVETWWDDVNPTMREILGLQFEMVTYQMICYKTHVSLERNWRMFFFLKVSGNLKSMHDICKSNNPVQCLSRVEKMSKTFTKARLCIRKKSCKYFSIYLLIYFLYTTLHQMPCTFFFFFLLYFLLVLSLYLCRVTLGCC